MARSDKALTRSSSNELSRASPVRAKRTRSSGVKSSKKITPYSAGFDQHLTDSNINAEYSSQSPDLKELAREMADREPSILASIHSENDFKRFQKKDQRAKDEADLFANVMPFIIGPNEEDHSSAYNTVFRGLTPITDGTISAPKPDMYDGAHPETLSRSIRDHIQGYIAPSKASSKPILPNLFLEVKGPDGRSSVAMRQARYYGAVGSRAMHIIQNYGKKMNTYDGIPVTFTCTYAHGTLKIYAHHVAAPTAAGELPTYHMTQIHGSYLGADRETFEKGVAAFRSVRAIAESYRIKFINAAHTRQLQKALPMRAKL